MSFSPFVAKLPILDVIKGTVKIRLKWFGDIFELSEKGVRDALVDPRGVFRIQSNI